MMFMVSIMVTKIAENIILLLPHTSGKAVDMIMSFCRMHVCHHCGDQETMHPPVGAKTFKGLTALML